MKKNYRHITDRISPIIIGLILLLPILTSAQQKPQYTQYIINNYIINPALTGIENYVDIKFGHRHQWVGLKGAPVTTYVTMHKPIWKDDYKTHPGTIFSIDDEPVRSKDMWKEYTTSPSHHGIGMIISNDKIGAFNNFSMMATYAYHKHLNPQLNLSAGIGIGISKYSINTDKLFFGIDYPIDPAVYGSGVLGEIKMDMSTGLWLYSPRFFIGGAMQQIVPNKIDYSSGLASIKGKYEPHLFVTAGYGFFFGDDAFIVPSVMVKHIAPVPTQVDINVKATFNDVFWVGGSYRHKYGFAAMTGVRASNKVMVSYSYDYSYTKIRTVSTGSHEIIVGLALNNRTPDNTRCPANLW